MLQAGCRGCLFHVWVLYFPKKKKFFSLGIQVVDKVSRHPCAMTSHWEFRHVEKSIVGQPEEFENSFIGYFFRENHVSVIVSTESLFFAWLHVCLAGLSEPRDIWRHKKGNHPKAHLITEKVGRTRMNSSQTVRAFGFPQTRFPPWVC